MFKIFKLREQHYVIPNKHQQEIFIDFYHRGFVKRKENYVNWDPIEKTVLANWDTPLGNNNKFL